MFFYVILLFFICIHMFIFGCLTKAFKKGFWQIPTAIWFIAMITVWYMRHEFANPQYGDFLLIGFTWLGFSILFACWLLAGILLSLVIRIFYRASRYQQQKNWLHTIRTYLAPRPLVCCALVGALLTTGYAWYEAHTIRPYEVTITTNKLPQGINSLRIVAISDVHIGRSIGVKTLQKVADIANAAKPDIFISLGDLVDAHMSKRTKEAAILRSIHAKYGSYAVLGNHEYYHNINDAKSFYQKAGLQLLQNTMLQVAGITLVGGDDIYTTRTLAKHIYPLLPHLRSSHKANKFTLLLNHRPVIADNAIGLPDLQLSGHTHGGQIWPGAIAVRYFFRQPPQHLSTMTSKNGKRSHSLIVSNGVGYWGPPLRLFSQPEVMIINLVR